MLLSLEVHSAVWTINFKELNNGPQEITLNKVFVCEISATEFKKFEGNEFEYRTIKCHVKNKKGNFTVSTEADCEKNTKSFEHTNLSLVNKMDWVYILLSCGPGKATVANSPKLTKLEINDSNFLLREKKKNGKNKNSITIKGNKKYNTGTLNNSKDITVKSIKETLDKNGIKTEEHNHLNGVDDDLDEDSLKIEEVEIGDFPNFHLRQRREILEKRNKIMVEKKIEDIRVKQEVANTNKHRTEMNQSNKEIQDQDKNESLEVILNELLVTENTSSPKKNNNEKINSVTMNLKGVIYNITQINTPNKNTMIEDSEINSASMHLVDNYCHTPKYKRLKDSGFNLTNSYSASNGDLLYEVTTNPSDCK